VTPQGQKLFDLLPAFYRVKDAQLSPLSPADSAQLLALQNTPPPLTDTQQQQLNQLVAKSRGPLQSLLMLIEEQLAVLANDLDQLYDDQFIETCAPWVIPYIGDLIGYQPVHGVAAAVASPRAEVAHTISFRRRKGTVLVLEQLARDLTGWGAHAVEFFRKLAVCQSMKQIRPGNHYAPDLRSWQTRAYIDTGFDCAAHKVDVRRIGIARGRYNIQNVGIFLWSLNAYPLTKVSAIPAGSSSQFFRFSPLGADVQLFNNPVSQRSDITAAAQPVNVPAGLPRRLLCQDIQSGAGAIYYGEGNSLALYLNNTLLNAYQIQICDLSGADGSWSNVPAAGSPYAACIDPELGRIALPSPLPSGSTLQTSFCSGFNGEMGGGEYARSDTFTVQTEASVLPYPDTASPARYTTLQGAITFAATNLDADLQVAVEITNSDVYLLNSTTAPGLQIQVPAGATIEFRAADGHRPTLVLGAEMTVVGGAGSTFNLNGFLVTYVAPAPNSLIPAALVHVPNVSQNQLGKLGLTHTTLVPGLALTTNGAAQFPGQASLEGELAGLQVTIQKSILGEMLVHELANVSLADSILDACGLTGVAYANLDGASGGASLTLQGCTVFGKVHTTLLALMSDSIVWAGLAAGDSWTAPLTADRKQQGCVRFSYLPAGAVVPRQFECVQQKQNAPQPMFYSMRYGDPHYAKLWPSTDDSIRRGADDGGEMGAFHFVLVPLRETDLLVRIQEYIPVGLEFGIFYQN
jgi:hypothetical protein